MIINNKNYNLWLKVRFPVFIIGCLLLSGLVFSHEANAQLINQSGYRFYNPSSLSAAFDSDGAVQSDPTSSTDYISSIAIDSNYIYLGGYQDTGGGCSTGSYCWRVEKRDKTTGALVTAFDTDGIVQSDPTSNWDVAYSIAIDSQYIYIVGAQGIGSGCTGSLYCWRLEKRDITTGALVNAFDSDGAVVSNPTTMDDIPKAVTIDSSYIYVGGYQATGGGCSTGQQCWRVEKRDITTGALVNAFDSDGIVQSDPSSGSDRIESIAVDSQYVYIAGYQWWEGDCTSYCWRLEKRDKTTGTLVNAFDSDGIVQSELTSGGDGINSIAIDSNYIYMGGYQSTGGGCSTGDYCWRVEKRDITTGALVNAFDSDGAVQSDPTSGSDIINSIAVDSSYIYLGGYQATGGGCSTGQQCWRVEKRDITTGALVNAFDSDGIVQSDPTSSGDYLNSIAIDSSYIYLGGYQGTTGGSCSTGGACFRVEKRDISDGKLVDTGFDKDGAVQSDPTSNIDQIKSIAIDSNYIYMGGYQYTGGGCSLGGNCWRVEKRDITTGALVNAFDSDGIVQPDPTSGNDQLYSIAIDSSYIYLGGIQSTGGGCSTGLGCWRVEKRDITTGALVNAFDSDGIVQSDPTSSNDSINSIAIDSNYIYLGGYQTGGCSLGNWCWRVEKRDITTGALVNAFDSDGIVQSDPTSSSDFLYSIAVDSNYIYLGGYQATGGGCSTGDNCMRLEKRDITTGALVNAFDSDGIVQSDPTSGGDTLTSIAIDSNYIYLGGIQSTGGGCSTGGNCWRVEKRDITTGVLVNAFDSDGIVQSDPTSGNDQLYSIAIDSNYIYLGGYQATGGGCSTGDNCMRLEKRDITTGALVNAFDSDGIVQSDPTSGGDTLTSIAIDSNYIYLGGIQSTGGGCSLGNDCWRVEKRDIDGGNLTTTEPTQIGSSLNNSNQPLSLTSSNQKFRLGLTLDFAFSPANSGAFKLQYAQRSGTCDSSFEGESYYDITSSTPIAYYSNTASNTDDSYAFGHPNYPDHTGHPITFQTYNESNDFYIVKTVPAYSDAYWDFSLQDYYADAGMTYCIRAVNYDGLPLDYYQNIPEVTTYSNKATIEQSAYRFYQNSNTQTSFDSDGIVHSDPTNSIDQIYSIATDSNYIYLGGIQATGGNCSLGNQCWRVEKRDKTTGSLVTAFDTDGIVQSDPTSSFDYITSIAIDSSYIYVGGFQSTGGNCSLGGWCWRVEKRDITTGALVNAFDSDGIVQSDPTNGDDNINSIAIDSNYIYLGGYQSTGGGCSTGGQCWRVEKRDKTTGALVNAFDSDGIVQSDPTSSDDFLYSIAIDSNYIYLGGYASSSFASGPSDCNTGGYCFRVEKRDITTGALVNAFDSDGIVQSDPTSGDDSIYSIAIDSNYIYLGGWEGTTGGGCSLGSACWRVEKRDITTGALVNAFDSDGIVQSDPTSSNDYIRSIAIDSSYIYLGGYQATGGNCSLGNTCWRVEKRDKTTGALVNAFDSDGIVQSDPTSSDDQIKSIAIDSNYIYLAGYQATGGGCSTGSWCWRLEKRDISNGGLSASSFASGGILQSDPTSSADYLYSIAVDSNYIYMGGWQDTGGNCSLGSTCFRVEKRDKTTGALVNAFDSDGIVQSDPTNSIEYLYSIAVDSNYIYMGGAQSTGGGCSTGSYCWRVEKRDITTGALVNAFDSDGIVQSDPTISSDVIRSIAIDSSYIYLGGDQSTGGGCSTGSDCWRVEKRDITTGALVNAFDSDGIVQSDPTSGNDYLQSIAIDSSYIYLGGAQGTGGNCSLGDICWRVEKRDITTGALVNAFDSDGIVQSDPTSGTDLIRSIAIDSSYIYLGGYQGTTGGNCSLGSYCFRLEKRDITTGALVNAFDSDGIVQSDPTNGDDQIYSIAIDSSYIYLGGYQGTTGGNCSLGSYCFRLEKRDITTGALVNAFDSDGIVQSDPTSSSDVIRSIAIDSSYIYMGGSQSTGGGCSTGSSCWRLEKRNLGNSSYVAFPPKTSTPLANTNTSSTLTSANQQFRLKLGMSVSGNELLSKYDSSAHSKFKLQYSPKSGSCDTSFSGESYADITAYTPIAFSDNSSGSDDAFAVASSSDPLIGSSYPMIQSYYESAEPFKPVKTLKPGQSGLWDFSLKDNNAPPGTSYCIRAVYNGGQLLESYSQIPEINIYSASPTRSTLAQTNYQWFTNADNVQPGSSVANENTEGSIARTANNVRLRTNITVTDVALNTSSQSFALQYSTSTSGPWYTVGGESSNWYNQQWKSRKKIYLNSTGITEDLTNFPVLITLDSSRIDYGKTNNSGYDLRFTDSNGTTLLSHEIDSWNESGKSYVWVKVPQIDQNTTSDYIWMYYNGTGSTDAQDKSNLWSNSYQEVYHLESTVADDSSTASINTGTISGPTTTTGGGKIGNSKTFDGTDDYIYTATQYSNPQNYTLSAWIKTSTASGKKILGFEDTQTSTAATSFTRHLYVDTSGYAVAGANDGVAKTASNSSSIADGNWHHIAGTHNNSTNELKIYVDGNLANTKTGVTSASNHTGYWRIGSYKLTNWTNGSDGYFTGDIDEVRISDTVRSPDWIKAEHRTMNDKMNTIGPEETYANHWRFYNNATPADMANISSGLLTGTTVLGSYLESNPSKPNPNSVSANSKIEYDFSLDPTKANPGVEYYFRVIRSDGTALDSYSNYPKITISQSAQAGLLRAGDVAQGYGVPVYGGTKRGVERVEENLYGGGSSTEHTGATGPAIYIGGLANGDFHIQKRGIDNGNLFSEFGTSGKITGESVTQELRSIAIDSRYIYLGGYQVSGCSLGSWCGRVEKRDITTGALINAFDSDGIVQSDPTTGADQIYSIAIDLNYIYSGGHQGGGCSAGNYCWRVEKRDITTGALVNAFDSDGIVQSDPTNGQDTIYSIAIDSNYIYMGGIQATGGGCSTGSYCWRVEKRDITTGALVNAFDSDGAVQSDPTSGIDELFSIAVDSSYVYLGGYQATGGNCSTGNECWRVEKRDITTGALVNAFDSDGIVQSDPTSSNDRINSIAIDSSYIYLGGYQITGGGSWRVEKRDITTGALVNAFDSDGAVESDPTSGYDTIRSIAVDSNYIYLGGIQATGGGCSTGLECWRVEKRDITTGALVNAFDSDGAVESDPSSNSDLIYSIAIDSSTPIYKSGGIEPAP